MSESYAWRPHKTHVRELSAYLQGIRTGVDTLALAESLVDIYIEVDVDTHLFPQQNDVAYLAIRSALHHTTNRDTLGLATDRIPQNSTLDATLSFLIAYIHERDVGMPALKAHVKTLIRRQHGKYIVPVTTTEARNATELWVTRADRIVELMQTARSKVGHFAADAEFMRNWALVDLGEATGVEVKTGNNPVQLGFYRAAAGTVNRYRMASQSITKLIALRGLWRPPASREYRYTGTDTVTVTSRNGPNRIRVKTGQDTWGAWQTLLEGASRTFTKAEMRYDIASQPIHVPAVLKTPADITLAVGVTESVDIDEFFSGIDVNLTAVSADTHKATVQVNQAQTSMGVIGVAAGTVTITVTATNAAGTTSVTFDVTVTEGSE